MNLFFLLAGSVALAMLVIHLVVGGRLFVRPLLASKDLRRVARLTLYYCWHLSTLLIAAMVALYLFSAAVPERTVPAVVATALAAGASLLSLLIIVVNRQRPWQIPQWLFFAIVTGLGIAGLTY